jgi:hypothetical protein
MIAPLFFLLDIYNFIYKRNIFYYFKIINLEKKKIKMDCFNSDWKSDLTKSDNGLFRTIQLE